jgi:uncharacterized membrane protein
VNVRQLELFISGVLRIGVVLSGLLILFGLGVFALTNNINDPTGVATLDWIIHGNPFLEPSHILFLGFIILVLTPLSRVATSVVAYAYEHDWTYVVITGFVLVVLVTGMVLGIG